MIARRIQAIGFRHEEGEVPIAHFVDLTDVRSLPDTVIAQDDRWQDLVPGNSYVGGTVMTEQARP
ncbi:hypothetical protein [Streptomyces sp. NPDC058086]|uniref:hypothetical protein n=1 Tax=Streptomyces sp. NPDC058086 TaxID=3346334 RepID=UPI0036E69C1A